MRLLWLTVDDVARQRPPFRLPLPALWIIIGLAVACSGSGGSNADGAPTATISTAVPAQPGASATPGPQPTRPAVVNDFDPNRVRVSTELAGSGFSNPDFITGAGDGSGRLFVMEKGGRIKLIDGSLFLDISDRVNSPGVNTYEREQGLLGLAFHPDFARNHFFYVHYNDRQGDHVVSRITAGANGRGDPATEKVLLRADQPDVNFNGGMLLFGADGYLYIGLGTGGTDRRLQDNAQDLGSLLGKILRIDVNGGDPYAIPPDNPFRTRAGARPEVWAYGLRNPWRFSFDRASGDLYIGSPGEFRREWVLFQAAGTPAGQNFGWPILEGNICYEGSTCNRNGLVLPIFDRNTYENGNCALIGGYVYRGTRQTGLRGAYLHGDFCSGRIWAAIRSSSGAWTSTEMTSIGSQISSFGEGDDGEVYVADVARGNIYRITAAPR